MPMIPRKIIPIFKYLGWIGVDSPVKREAAWTGTSAVLSISTASRLMPVDVISYAHDNNIAIGKPIINKTITSVSAQSGSNKAGKVTSPICIIIHETRAYMPATRNTLRRLNS